MADTKFKVGDKVRLNPKGRWCGGHTEGTIIKIIRYDSADAMPYRVQLAGTKEAYWQYEEDVLGLAGKTSSGSATPPKFILQYELDADPFEFFATEKEARKRIAELAERTDLKRDSIRLIEIKKIRTVKLGTKITISK